MNQPCVSVQTCKAKFCEELQLPRSVKILAHKLCTYPYMPMTTQILDLDVLCRNWMHVSAQNCIGTEQCKPTRSELCGSVKWHIFLYLMYPNFRDDNSKYTDIYIYITGDLN